MTVDTDNTVYVVVSDDAANVVVSDETIQTVVVPTEQVVTTTVSDKSVVSIDQDTFVTVPVTSVQIVAVGAQGPAGGGGGSDVFILDIGPSISGIVGGKTYVADTVPANVELVSCQSDTANVRVYVGSGGGVDNYSPTITVNGVAVTLTESATKRWFTGWADVVLVVGENIITAVSDAGGEDTATVTLLGGGPSVLSVVFGAYPGTQTELKAGDTITATITTDADAVSVTVLDGAVGTQTLAVTAGVATATLVVAGLSGAQPVTVRAQNSFGTFGTDFDSAALTLNQTYPTIGAMSVAYPATQSALKGTESGTVTCSVTNYDSVTYSSAQLIVTQPTTYAAVKTVTNDYVGYVNSGTNYTITAIRDANAATTISSGLVKIAAVAPTAAITTNPSGRMVSSPTGTDYDVRIWPSQTLQSAPTLVASVGAWQGSWTNMGTYWKRAIRIADAVPRGAGLFSSLVVTGLAGLAGSSITSGAAYEVGGYSSRALLVPAFSRVVAIGVAVADQAKTTAVIGAQSLTRYTENGIHTNGYYIANAAGDYDATGSYIGISDSVFAGSNTTGTLQITTQETA